MPVQRWGIRGRVVAASVGALAVCLIALTAGANLLLADQLDRDANNVLRDRAAAQLATLGVVSGKIVVHEGTRDAVLDQRAWVFVGGREIERGLGPSPIQRAAAGLAGMSTPTVRNAPGDVRLRAEPLLDTHGVRVGTVVVGASLVPYEDTEHIGLLASVMLSFFVLLAGGALIWRAVGAALRPVADMTARVADWSEHDLHRRFDLGPARDELTGLAATLDGLLARIEGALRHEKRFSAEMAHELRTPLASMRAEAELGLREGPDDRRVALRRIVALSDRMEGVIESLLAISRQEVDPEVTSVDAVEAASSTVEASRSVATARGVELTLDGVGAPRASASADVAVRALQPLVENAIRHARHDVHVRVETDHTDVLIRVSDDGEGVAANHLEAIFNAGMTVGKGGGAGLGLPLARRLARSCGGDVEAQAGPGGRFALRLPSV